MLTLLLCAVLGAEPKDDPAVGTIPPRILYFLDEAEAYRIRSTDWFKQRVPELKFRLRKARRADIDPSAPGYVQAGPDEPDRAPSKDARTEMVERLQEGIYEAEQSLKDLGDRSKVSVPIMSIPPAVDKIGRLNQGFRVINVIDSSNVIADTTWVVQPPGEAKTYHFDVWLAGVDTSKMADGSASELDGCFVVSGTKQYVTVTGAKRTLLMFEPFDLEEAEKWMPAYRDLRKPLKKK